MPIDAHRLRADRHDGDLAAVREDQRKRFKPETLVDEVLEIDCRWRDCVARSTHMRGRINQFQKEVIAPMKKQRQDCQKQVGELQAMQRQSAILEGDVANCSEERDAAIARLGNIVDPSVPVSENPEADNLLITVWPSPPGLDLPCPLRTAKYALPAMQPLTHDDLLWRIGGYDPCRGQKVAGSRGYFLRGNGVLLNQALINYALAFLRRKGYSAVQPPYFMKRDLMNRVAQLSDFDDQLYRAIDPRSSSADPEHAENKYLIATSEQPICAYHYKETLEAAELPIRYAGISTCFRREVGSMNKDIRGIFRVHQFEKVEQFCITQGNYEDSKRMHEEMIACAEEFHQSLGLAYRVTNIVSGDLNDAAAIKYDLEGWFPGQQQYRELVSCSNCTDFQARALEIRARARNSGSSKAGKSELSYVHMLNSTLTATGRGICCILETYQKANGVQVPEALVPFMGGIDFMPFVQQPTADLFHGQGTRKGDTLQPVEALSAPEQDPPHLLSGALPKASAGAKAAMADQGPAISESSSVSVKAPCEPAFAESNDFLQEGASLNITALEIHLDNFAYAGGHTPSRLDVKILEMLRSVHHPLTANIERWHAHIHSFTKSERLKWR